MGNNLTNDPVVKMFLDDIDGKVAKCREFHEKILEARKKIIAERVLKPDAYTRPITL